MDRVLILAGGTSRPIIIDSCDLSQKCQRTVRELSENCQRTVKFLAGRMAAGPLGCYRHSGTNPFSALNDRVVHSCWKAAVESWESICSDRRLYRRRDVYSSPTARQPYSPGSTRQICRSPSFDSAADLFQIQSIFSLKTTIKFWPKLLVLLEIVDFLGWNALILIPD